MSFEKDAYEIEELWAADQFGEAERVKARELRLLIPPDARSLLDAGCGNGFFANGLAAESTRFDRICGVDRSEAALRHVKVERHQASIDRLPFADGEFDIVCSSNVIEHLPGETYGRALSELARVSSRYLLITVPFDEDLDDGLHPCPQCRTRYNMNYHMHRYDNETMLALFSGRGWVCNRVQRILPSRIDPPFVRRALRVARRTFAGDAVPFNGVCPMCGFQTPTSSSGATVANHPGTSRIGLLRALIPQVASHRWITALYERR